MSTIREDAAMTGTNGITLDAASLASKWGFGDGDLISEWWWDAHDDDPPVDDRDLLEALVRTYLVPVITNRGHTIELVTVDTIHNPIRAESIDGAEVDWYAQTDQVEDITVTVTAEQIEAVALELQQQRPAP